MSTRSQCWRNGTSFWASRNVPAQPQSLHRLRNRSALPAGAVHRRLPRGGVLAERDRPSAGPVRRRHLRGAPAEVQVVVQAAVLLGEDLVEAEHRSRRRAAQLLAGHLPENPVDDQLLGSPPENRRAPRDVLVRAAPSVVVAVLGNGEKQKLPRNPMKLQLSNTGEEMRFVIPRDTIYVCALMAKL